MGNYNGAFPTANPTKAGDSRIDGILGYGKWGDATLTYSFPTRGNVYYQSGYPAGGYTYLDGNHFDAPKYFIAFNPNQQTAAQFALDKDSGDAASAGFAVEGFTNLKVNFASTADTTDPKTFRFGNTRSPGVPNGYAGHAGPLGGYYSAGDVWMDADYVRTPVAGEVGWRVVHHELGHALGLTHAVGVCCVIRLMSNTSRSAASRPH